MIRRFQQWRADRRCTIYGHVYDEWAVTRARPYTEFEIRVRCERCSRSFTVAHNNGELIAV